MKKYWVPAIERADSILKILANHPRQYRLIDLSNELNINKSSMFSLLNTLEDLHWVKKEKDGTYALGLAMGMFSASYFHQLDLVEIFHQIAPLYVERIGETAQLAILNDKHIFYLAKQESQSPIRIATDPGMTLPAHAPSLGKVLLSQFTYKQLIELYPDEPLEPLTPYTVKTRQALWEQLQYIKENGYVFEQREATKDFYCVAAPIWNYENHMIAAVCFTMLEGSWKEKKERAITEILNLANHLSEYTGHME